MNLSVYAADLAPSSAVSVDGAERPLSWLNGAPGGTRTHDLQVRNLTLYPLSYGRKCQRKLAEREGFEPSEQVTPLNGLANRRTRPLCDLSAFRRAQGYHADRPFHPRLD